MCLRRLFTMGAPSVRLGTKWPSCSGMRARPDGLMPAALGTSREQGASAAKRALPPGSGIQGRTMTSTCSQSAPRSTIRWHSSASLWAGASSGGWRG